MQRSMNASKKRNLKRNIGIGVACICIGILLGVVVWDQTAYQPAQVATAIMTQPDEHVTITASSDAITFYPKESTAQKGFIIYPGAKVEGDAYAPLANALSQAGYPTVIAHMPLQFAMLGKNRAAAIIEQNPTIKEWVMIGHSLGGVVASQYAITDEKVTGLVLLASYPMQDMHTTNKKVLSIWGTEDGVLNKENLEISKNKLPQDTLYVPLDGANHAQFGDYGLQKGDGDATIDATAQLEQTVVLILNHFTLQ